MTTWGSAVVEAARAFRDKFGSNPADGNEAEGSVSPPTGRYAMHAFGAQFVEAKVHADSGEIRVPRLLGVFAAGRIINPRTARSQFIGGMTMGLSMALHERSVLDPRFGHIVNHDSPTTTSAPARTSVTSRRTGSTSTIRTSTRWARRGSARSGSRGPPRRWSTRCITPPESGFATSRSPWTHPGQGARAVTAQLSHRRSIPRSARKRLRGIRSR